MKNVCILSFFLLSLPAAGMSQASWDAVGPFGGWINVLTKDVSGNIYAGTYVGGIFKTSNNGDTWVQIYNDTLIIDPQAVALNSSGDIFVGASPGFLRSTNGGTSWQKINNALNTRNVVDLLVLVDGTILAGCWPGGVYRSTDNGTTFNTINNGLSNTDVRSLAVKASNGYLFAATYGGGVFRSTDGGVSWNAVNNGITGPPQMSWVGVSPTADIYTIGVQVFRSTNNGDNWTILPSSSASFSGELAFGSNAIYHALDGGVNKSTDNGTTWAQESGLPNILFNRVIVSGNTIVAGSGGLGTYRSSGTISPSDTWTQIVDGMTNTHVVAIDDASNGDVFAATQLAGVFRSTNAGLTWFPASNGIPADHRLAALAVSPATGTVFASGSSGGYRSTDQGASWTNAALGGASTVGCNSRGDVFAGINDRVWRSTDDGVTWSFAILSLVENIADLAFDGDTVYAATGVGSGFGTSRGVYRSTDNGNTWAAYNNGLTNLNVTTIVVSDTTTPSQRTSALQQNYDIVACGTAGSGIFASNVTWVQCSDPSFYVTDLENYREFDLGAFFLAILFPSYVFSEKDDCTPVEIVSPKNKELTIAKVVAGPTNPIVMVGTNGSGIIRSENAITSVGGTPTSPDRFILKQNYPNPFNPNTTIRYELPKASYVTLKVYNVLGQEMATLVNGIENVGHKSVEWDASRFPSGMYVYKLTAGSFVDVKKMLLVK